MVKPLDGFSSAIVEGEGCEFTRGGESTLGVVMHLLCCDLCGALVVEEDQLKHRQYHEFRGDPLK